MNLRSALAEEQIATAGPGSVNPPSVNPGTSPTQTSVRLALSSPRRTDRPRRSRTELNTTQ